MCARIQSCPALCNPMDPARLLCPWDFPGKNIGVGCYFLLQGTFLTQKLNLGLLPCRQTLPTELWGIVTQITMWCLIMKSLVPWRSVLSTLAPASWDMKFHHWPDWSLLHVLQKRSTQRFCGKSVSFIMPFTRPSLWSQCIHMGYQERIRGSNPWGPINRGSSRNAFPLSQVLLFTALPTLPGLPLFQISEFVWELFIVIISRTRKFLSFMNSMGSWYD